MLKAAGLALLLCLIASTCFAQSSTSTGVGVGVANSKSQSAAVAISGQGGQGGTANGNGTSSSALTINSAAQPAVTTSNVNQNVSGTQTVKNVPTVFSPGLSAAGIETCLGSFSVGVGWVGAGVSGGSTVPDEDCQARLDARTLAQVFGLKAAAVARLCQRPNIWRSMPDICARYTPQAQPAGYVGPGPLILSASAGAPIDVIDGKTGIVRPCDDYDAVKFHCRKWQGQPRQRTRVAHVAKPSAKSAVENIKPAVEPAAAPAAEEPKKEN